MPGFGGSIKLTGEEAYRQALKGIAADLKSVAAEQKLTAATYDKADSSLSALSKRSDDLKAKLDVQKQKWDTLSKSLKDYQSQQEKNKNVIQSVQSQLDKERQKLEEVAKQFGTTSREYKEQAKVVDDLEQQLKELNTQYDKNELTIKKTSTALKSTEADIKKTTNQMQALGKQAEEAGVGSEKLGLAVDDAGKKAQDAANGGFTVLKGILANLASQVITKAVEGFKTLARNVYEAGTSFDAAMSQVGAVSGATGKDLEALTEKAKEMGSTTKFSASEAAEAFNYMAMAGWKTEDMINGIDGVLNLAAAAGADLATTSDIVTDALTAMGYSAKDAGRLADVMAAASSNANTNVEMMGETFKYAASVAGSLGYSMEDVALATGLMANSGVKASMAGTALRSIMQRIATDTGDAATTMHQMGIETTNADGTMRPLRDIMGDLRKAMANLTDEQKTATAKTIAGTEAMGGLLAIINASETDYNKLTNAIDNSSGAAERMAKTMQNNVAGKMTALKSQLEGIYLTIWNKVEPAISKAISSISRALKNVDWDSFGKKAGEALTKLVNAFTWLLEHGNLVAAAIKGVLAAFVIAKVVDFTTSIVGTVTALTKAISAAQGFSGALGAIGAAVSANPIGLLIGLLGGVAVAVGSVVSSLNDAESEVDEFSEQLEEQTNRINDNKTSWEELKKAQQESLNTEMTHLTHVTALKDELLSLVDANGKVKEGYEGRVGFILGELNNALGTEYTMTGNVIDKYGELVDSIDEVIEKKKAQIILNSQEAAYEEAITKQRDAYLELDKIYSDYIAKKEEKQKVEELYNELLNRGVSLNNEVMIGLREKMGTLDEETSNLKDNYNNQLGLLDEYAYNIGVYEQNMSLAHEGRYDEMTTATWDYVKELQKAGDSEKGILEGNVKSSDLQLEHLQKLYEKTGNEIYLNQIENAKKQKAANEENLKTYTSTTEQGLKKNKDHWLENTADVLSKLSGKKVEFKQVGDDQVQYYEDGMAIGEPIARKRAEIIARDTLAEFDKQAEAEGAGKNVITGFTNGEGNMSLQNTAFRVAQNFAGSILDKLKSKLGIASPSKETRKMGEFLLQGLGLGIKDEQADVLRQAVNFGGAVIDAMNDGLSAGVDTSALDSLRAAIPEDIAASYKASEGGNYASVQAEIERNSLVGAFKQALSEMKIEMDDYEMGKFVDKTVSRAIYS